MKDIEFDWSVRTGVCVLALPFTEGVPTTEKAKAMTMWVRANADRYARRYVKMYHATNPSLPIEDEGLKPTSNNRRRSFQSTSGYVYLANSPERAKNFGDAGNQGSSVVYEVLVAIRSLSPDRDQLDNQRLSDHDVGNSIGESIIFGGGARVKGHIEPWAIRKLPPMSSNLFSCLPVAFAYGEDEEADSIQVEASPMCP